MINRISDHDPYSTIAAAIRPNLWKQTQWYIWYATTTGIVADSAPRLIVTAEEVEGLCRAENPYVRRLIRSLAKQRRREPEAYAEEVERLLYGLATRYALGRPQCRAALPFFHMIRPHWCALTPLAESAGMHVPRFYAVCVALAETRSARRQFFDAIQGEG